LKEAIYKIGDEIYCKKDYKTFEKGKYYKIVDVMYDDVDYIVMTDNYQHNKLFSIVSCFEPYFWDYFHSNSEIRKKKLEQIKQINA